MAACFAAPSAQNPAKARPNKTRLFHPSLARSLSMALPRRPSPISALASTQKNSPIAAATSPLSADARHRDDILEAAGNALSNCLSETHLDRTVPGLHSKARGKVRDVYDAGDHLVLVTTDRLSAFDRVLASIPFKDLGQHISAVTGNLPITCCWGKACHTLLFKQCKHRAPEVASMERHTCNLCLRCFPNGRALGGHMRSHVVSTAPSHLAGDSFVSTSSKEAGLSYSLRTNHRKSFHLVDPQFSSSFAEPGGSCVVVHDWESDTESPRAQSSRSKRPRRTAVSPPEAEPVSSVSDATAEEDVALCLMMLSRDSWAAAAEGRPPDEEEEEVERRPAARSRGPSRKGRTRYQCDACKKVFRSYQALGGHRATQKKTGCRASVVVPQIYSEADSADINADAKVHECPFCSRVFSSGQALGGHKRSHLVSSSFQITGNSPVSDPRSQPTISPVIQHLQIDLNLPAQADDDVELSAVSDVDFIATHSSRQCHAI